MAISDDDSRYNDTETLDNRIDKLVYPKQYAKYMEKQGLGGKNPNILKKIILS